MFSVITAKLILNKVATLSQFSWKMDFNLSKERLNPLIALGWSQLV